MQRRDFLSSTGATALTALPLAAAAQARPKDVLVVANEFGPNSLDIHTVETPYEGRLAPTGPRTASRGCATTA